MLYMLKMSYGFNRKFAAHRHPDLKVKVDQNFEI